MSEVLMTAEHKKELEARLQYLKVQGRPEAAERIRVAREFGDLSENAEYDIAKEEQAKMEAEIAEIDAKLKKAKIIDEKKKGDSVDFGTKILIENVATKQQFEYTIVGSSESNPFKGKISNDSPIGKAMLGKRKGDEVSVKAPAGDIIYKVLKVG
ncbi:MAG: transcription elongation factor GreA [Defluviitaleaceae bacterium]|nr:transcription elongation factor GreA [Defluviitaleaceae bacterium]